MSPGTTLVSKNRSVGLRFNFSELCSEPRRALKSAQTNFFLIGISRAITLRNAELEIEQILIRRWKPVHGRWKQSFWFLVMRSEIMSKNSLTRNTKRVCETQVLSPNVLSKNSRLSEKLSFPPDSSENQFFSVFLCL